jgi:hypothetical protein
MNKGFILVALLSSFTLFAQKVDHHILEIKQTNEVFKVDGKATESFWSESPWLALDQRWIGAPYSSEDFSGKYKLRWNAKGLYLLVEVVDDVLYDQYKDPLKLWWDDDCVEVFVDSDNSGGEHQYNHNAFAYHVAYDGNVIDIAPDKDPRYYNNHVSSAHTKSGNTYTWELLVKLYDDSFVDGQKASPLQLEANTKVGFALAYCDNDGSKERENFIGSVFVPGEDKNQGWINASIFSTLQLIK